MPQGWLTGGSLASSQSPLSFRSAIVSVPVCPWARHSHGSESAALLPAGLTWTGPHSEEEEAFPEAPQQEASDVTLAGMAPGARG